MYIQFTRDYSYVYSYVPALHFTDYGMSNVRTVPELQRETLSQSERFERSSGEPYLDGSACQCDMAVHKWLFEVQ